MNMAKSVERVVRKTGAVLVENAPKILVALGIGCAVGGAVLVAKETPAAQKVVEDTQVDLAKLHELKAELDETQDGIEFSDQETGEVTLYTQKDYTKDLIKVYLEAGVKLGKVYAPAIITEAAGIAAILGSHGIMRNRNTALAASLLTTEKAYKRYRDRVIEDHGKEYDRDVMFGIRRGEVEVPVYKKNGEVKTDKDGVVKTEMKDSVEFEGLDEYSFWFDSRSNYFNKNGNIVINNDFCMDLYDYFQKMMRLDGYVYVNDIRKAFGVPLTEEGATAGWLYDPHGDLLGAAQDFVDMEWSDVSDICGNCTDEQRDKFNKEHGAILVNLRPMLSNINPYVSKICFPSYPRED